MNTSNPITEKVSPQVVRQVMLAAQGLDRAPDQPATKADLLNTVRRIGVLQIDTIHVIQRSPYIVLWSRLGDFRLGWLEELLAEKALFEYWAHAMCFLPIEDYPLYRRGMLDAVKGHGWPVKWAVDWAEAHPELTERIRTHIRENGAVRSAEFENKNHPAGGWWNWKEEKDALESLFLTGELMIARRQNFQRVYDLRERVLPDGDDTAVPTSDEVRRTLTLRAVQALGIALASWVPDYYRLPKKGIRPYLDGLAGEGQLLRLAVAGLEEPAYIHPEQIGLLEEAISGKREPTLTTLLSPFDPLVWDRQRAREIFSFDYTIECYTPAAKRQYGYFTLPILQRGRLVGRLDPKAHRSQGLFEIKSIHLEPGVAASEELAADLADVLRRFAAWHGTPEIVIRQSNPPSFAAMLNSAL